MARIAPFGRKSASFDSVVVEIAVDEVDVLCCGVSMALLRGSDNPAYRLRAGNAYLIFNKHAGYPPSSSEY
jgi:hypothetical protein